MYYQSVINEKYLLANMSEDKEKETLLEALELFNKSSYDGHKTLSELISSKNSNAILLSSMYSKENETEEDFDQRHITLIRNASLLGNPLAHYAMGIYYDLGTYCEEDKEMAKEFFKKSAELKMPQAMVLYGIMLYYGTGGVSINTRKGLEMINQALNYGETSAKEFLEYLKKEKKWL